jgi:hypothetical protein
MTQLTDGNHPCFCHMYFQRFSSCRRNLPSGLSFEAELWNASQDKFNDAGHHALCAHLGTIDKVYYSPTSAHFSDYGLVSSMCSLAGLICVSPGVVILAEIDLNSTALCPTTLFPSHFRTW